MYRDIANIYRDVLIEGWKIAIIKRDGNDIDIVTYFHYEPMMDLVNRGYDLEIMLQHTMYNLYFLGG